TGRRRSSCSTSAVRGAWPPQRPRTFMAPTTRCSTPSVPIRRTTSESRSCRPGPNRAKRVAPLPLNGPRLPARTRTNGATSNLGRLRRRDQLALLEQQEDLRRGLLRALVLGVERELGAERRLIRVGDSGELLDLALERLLVETLH